jgi:hypothetical protein
LDVQKSARLCWMFHRIDGRSGGPPGKVHGADGGKLAGAGHSHVRTVVGTALGVLLLFVTGVLDAEVGARQEPAGIR